MVRAMVLLTQPENEDDLHLHNPVARVVIHSDRSRLTGAGGARMLSRFPEGNIALGSGFFNVGR